MTKTRRTVMVPSMVALSCLIIGSCAYAQSAPGTTGGSTGPSGNSNATAQPKVAFNVSGPYKSGNLGIYLIHGQDTAPAQNMITLQEALENKQVVVHETGDVNELSVENKGTLAVFFQSGDIVKGGRQDRTLQNDMILKPKSGKVPIKAFCVESGRWAQRGAESGSQFTKSSNMLASKGLKIAAKSKASQGDVWNEVSSLQRKYISKARYGATNGTIAAAPVAQIRGGSAGAGAPRIAARPNHRNAVALPPPPSQLSASLVPPPPALATASPTSLQLTLETDGVKQMSNTYQRDLSGVVKGKNDVVGYAFAVNGKLNSVDVYSSHKLFTKMWPKLLTASIQEAAAETEDKDAKAPSVDEIKRYLKDADSGKESKENIGGRSIVVRKESNKNLFYETRDKISGKEEWVHRNYLTK